MKSIVSIALAAVLAHGAFAGEQAEEADDAESSEGVVETSGDDRSDKDVDDTAVIGHIESRSHRVTILAAEEGERYSVYDRDGNLLDEELDEDKLLALFPDLHRTIHQGLADEPIMMRYDHAPRAVTPPVMLHRLDLDD